MILEGIVTTLDGAGALNIAPMGPRVEPDLRRFVLRPFKTSTTYRNLVAHGEGVLHVTDDALFLARAALGLPLEARTRTAQEIRGIILTDSCSYHEFRVIGQDLAGDRGIFEAETQATGQLRPFFGWNRAKHAVIEAAILATRIDILPMDQILEELTHLYVPVQKTAGPAELEAFSLLARTIHQAARDRGIEPGASPS